MNWEDLKYFLAVAREGSVSGAARALQVQHTTVSRRIKALEKQLGARLLERKHSGYELTNAGEKLEVAARRMEHEILDVESQLEGRDAILQGDLRVTAINNMASSILMPCFARFCKRYPQIRLHLIVSNKYVSLPEREADIAIRLTNTPPENLIGKRLTTVASTVYASRDYLRRMKTKGEEPQWIGVNCCGFHQTWTAQSTPQKEFHLYSDDTLLTKSAIKAGLGISWLPCFMGDNEPDMVRYQKPPARLELGLWLLFHPDLRRSARVLAFRDHMIREMDNLNQIFSGKL